VTGRPGPARAAHLCHDGGGGCWGLIKCWTDRDGARNRGRLCFDVGVPTGAPEAQRVQSAAPHRSHPEEPERSEGDEGSSQPENAPVVRRLVPPWAGKIPRVARDDTPLPVRLRFYGPGRPGPYGRLGKSVPFSPAKDVQYSTAAFIQPQLSQAPKRKVAPCRYDKTYGCNDVYVLLYHGLDFQWQQSIIRYTCHQYIWLTI